MTKHVYMHTSQSQHRRGKRFYFHVESKSIGKFGKSFHKHLVDHIKIAQYNHRSITAKVAKIIAISFEPRIQMIKYIVAVVEAKVAQPKARLGARYAKIGKSTKQSTARVEPF